MIAGHPLPRLADDRWFETWIATAPPEALIVSYSDKRAGQRLESMADRFAHWIKRYPPQERTSVLAGGWSSDTLALVRARSERIERMACELAGVAPEQVRRLRWTGAAMREAVAAATGSPAGPTARRSRP